MIVSIVSKKGGVGKSTTAVSLGAALAAQGRRVLLVDLDPQASASLWMGVARTDLAPSVADVLLTGANAAGAIRRMPERRLDLLTASADLLQCERELTTLREPDVVLRQRLRPAVEGRYDYTLLDAPAGMSVLTMNALVASDAFLVPATPDFLALEGLDNLLQATERIAFRNRVRVPCLGILLTKVDDRTRLSRDTATRIREQYGHRVFNTEVHGNVRIAEAPAYGQTIFEYDPRSRSASDYRLLAVEVELRRERQQMRQSVEADPRAARRVPASPLSAPASAAAEPTTSRPSAAATPPPAPAPPAAAASAIPTPHRPPTPPSALPEATSARPAGSAPPSGGASTKADGEEEESRRARTERPIWLRGLGSQAG